jgi:hypothetical protein
MPHYPDEVISYTRDDLLQALADELGSPADDPRILDAYDQIVSEWALTAEDPDAEYARYFRDGCSRVLPLTRAARTAFALLSGVGLPFDGSSHATRSRSLRDGHLLWPRVACPMGGPGRETVYRNAPGSVARSTRCGGALVSAAFRGFTPV